LRVTTGRQELRPEPQSVRAARESVRALEEHLEPGLFFDLSLCVSELVAHAVHGATSGSQALIFEAGISDGLVWAVVADPVAAANGSMREPPDEDLGLYIVSRLASGWGHDAERGRLWLSFAADAGSGSRVPAFAAEVALGQ
jgi:hypothetical protein